MRKKLFAIVMSMTMVASFMPSLAFAAVTADDAEAHSWPMLYVDMNNESTNSSVENLTAVGKAAIVEYVPATCTEKGSVTFKCKDSNNFCEETKTVVLRKENCDYADQHATIEEYCKLMQAKGATGFKNDAQTATKIAEYAAGDACYFNVKVCKDCGKIQGAVAAVPHEHPTNEGDNCKTTTNCTYCGKVINKKATLPKHSFQKEDGTLKEDAVATSTKELCSKDDKKVVEKTYTCTVCGATETKIENKESLGCRVYKNPVTVEKVGGKLYVVGTATVVDAAHGYIQDTGVANRWYKSDTTVTEGNTTYYGFTCDGCGRVVKGEVKSTVSTAHKHTWKKITKDATCVAPAKEALECTGCGRYANVSQEKVESPATTDDVDAEDLFSNIKNSKKLGHKLSVKTVEGTCKTKAHYEISCSQCDKEFADVDFDGLAKDTVKYLHADGTATTAVTDITDTKLAYLDPTVKNHVFTKKEVLKEATCEVGEISSYKCDVCGKIKAHGVSVKAGTALGHDYPVEKVEATCLNKAYEIKGACTRCGYELPANVTANTKAVKDAEIKDGKHTFDKWVVTKASTVFEEGVKTLTCSACGVEHESTKTVIAKKTVAKASNTVKAGKKSFNVKSSAANATGYRVYYKKAGAKSWKSYTKKTDSLSKTFSGLSKGKYYVKVKAYAKNYAGDGEVVWGATSATKTVKVK